MTKETVVKIPIRPHLKKFVLKQLGADPIIATERDFLGNAIMAVLNDKRNHNQPQELYRMTERITVVLTKEMKERSPRLGRIVYVNTLLSKQFRDALVIWVQAQVHAQIPANQACKNFLEHYRIDENEYTYDGLYKIWQRHKDDRQKKQKKAP
jgi:hypothetical protein